MSSYYGFNDFRDYKDLYLEHYGIPGMKWGVRRYQNADGSYTAAGRKRYGMDLDINDKSRTNIAKIRLGEARRRYDVAKSNRKTKIGDRMHLKSRVDSAKEEVRRQKKIEKGAKAYAKGHTIMGNRVKTIAGYGTAIMASEAMNNFMNSRLNDLGAQGRLTAQHIIVGKSLVNASSALAFSAASIYGDKNVRENRNLRAYYDSKATGGSNINKVGSGEYKDVVKRRSK